MITSLRKMLVPLVLLALAASAGATVSVNATLTDAQGNPQQYAFLKLHLNYCGYNVPVVTGGGLSIVAKDLVLLPSQLPATIYANNEITCGNSYSTLWHVTAYLDSSTPIAGDLDYDLCSTTTNCADGVATLAWNLNGATPFNLGPNSPPAPGFQTIFGNPTSSQVINQPLGGSGATVTVTVSGGGAINGCVVTAGGSNYQSPPALQISGLGTGGLLYSTVSGGVLTACAVAAGGTGYSAAPAVTVFGGTSLAIKGVLDLSGATIIPGGTNVPLLLGNIAAGALTATSIFSTTIENVQYADQYLTLCGGDIGCAINTAYAALGVKGGHIVIAPKADGSCYSYSTPIVLNTAGKYVLLESGGSGGLIAAGATGTWSGCLNYTPLTATSAITLDYATATTSAAAGAHGLKNIVLVNALIGQYTGTSSATGIMTGATNNGIMGATMENVTVAGFSQGYYTNNFNSAPVTWINPNFWFNTTDWVIGNVSTQDVYGGQFASSVTYIAAPTGSSGCGAGCFPSEMTFYGTSFIGTPTYAFDYNNNTTCCAQLSLYSPHIELFFGSSAHALRGPVDYFQDGGVIEDDSTGASGSDFWFNAQGAFFTIKDAFIQAKSALNTPSTGVIKDSTTTTVNFSARNNSLASLPCANLVGGTAAATATINVLGGTAAQLCTAQYQNPQQFQRSVAIADSGICTLGTNCSAINLSGTYNHAPGCFALWDKNLTGSVTGILSYTSSTVEVTFTSSVGGDVGNLFWGCFGN
jgi:hypothetical protein